MNSLPFHNRAATRLSGLLLVTTLTLAMSVLGGCSGNDEEPEVRPNCPRVSVLADAARLTRFTTGSGQDLLDIDFQAEVTDLFAGCNVVTNEAGETVLVVAIAPQILASRGPANQSQRAAFEYFVSVIENNSTILQKQTFPVAVAFPGNRRRVVYRDDNPPVTVDLPWQEPPQSREYEILLGFQLTEADLRYNRETPGSGQ